MTNRRRRREERATGATADDALAEWAADIDPHRSLHRVHEMTAGHRVNGTSLGPAPTSAVDVLESGQPEER
jgi:hypothetical protein